MEAHKDAFGQVLWCCLQGGSAVEIIEREDGFIEMGGGISYFSQYDVWPEIQKQAFEYVMGRVLDIGCGAGRHALYCQEVGLDVLAIDTSPLAIKVCQERGLNQAKVLPVTQIRSRLGVWGTILMLGNNFGVLANVKRARWLLKRLANVTSPEARILAETLDPYRTTESIHLTYHKQNVARGRLGGRVRFRVRYKAYCSDWVDYLFVSKEEMEMILEGTGWQVRRYLNGQGASYIAVIEKTKT